MTENISYMKTGGAYLPSLPTPIMILFLSGFWILRPLFERRLTYRSVWSSCSLLFPVGMKVRSWLTMFLRVFRRNRKLRTDRSWSTHQGEIQTEFVFSWNKLLASRKRTFHREQSLIYTMGGAIMAQGLLGVVVQSFSSTLMFFWCFCYGHY